MASVEYYKIETLTKTLICCELNDLLRSPSGTVTGFYLSRGGIPLVPKFCSGYQGCGLYYWVQKI